MIAGRELTNVFPEVVVSVVTTIAPLNVCALRSFIPFSVSERAKARLTSPFTGISLPMSASESNSNFTSSSNPPASLTSDSLSGMLAKFVSRTSLVFRETPLMTRFSLIWLGEKSTMLSPTRIVFVMGRYPAFSRVNSMTSLTLGSFNS